MTPETKAFIEEVKKLISIFIDGGRGWKQIGESIAANHILKALQIIESKEREIEKLNFIITTVLNHRRKLSKIEGLEAK